MSLSISLIVAVAENGVIGRDNTIPWRLEKDMKRFKQLTSVKPVIMGRKTWDSLGKPLPERFNIVVTRKRNFKATGALVVHSLAAALLVAESEAEKRHMNEIFVIGGSKMFKKALPYVDKMYITEVLASVKGDVCFPGFRSSDWLMVAETMISADEKNDHLTRYVIYERKPLKVV
ncbi:MAG: dihydrofolate reductase [Candidatus Tokpelaia sp. JSC085]|nr:MAG: dihydrofolate reductase [Candidatus Tokpelaia sp. JSC085]